MDAVTGDIRAAVTAAEDRIRPYVRETPLESSPFLGERAGREVHLKMENLQHTGSFKVRGALNKLLSLSPGEREGGIVAASSGNHGAAVAFGAKKLGLRCRVFVPEGASQTKVRAMERLGAEVLFHSTDTALSEVRARQDAAERGAVYVSPYNDLDVISGQGTISVEILRQLDSPEEIFVPVGGGGLISGVAGYLKGCLGEDIRVIGCQPANSAVMAGSVGAGRILEMESYPTLSDGTAGGVEPGALTFDLCSAFVDEWVLVSEEEIAGAMRLVMEVHHTMIEGAAAVGVAALIKSGGKKASGKNATVVLCGANIALETLGKVLER